MIKASCSNVGIQIHIETGKPIRVNDQDLDNLASSPVHYPAFTIVKAGLFAIISGKHFRLKWDFGMCSTDDERFRLSILKNEFRQSNWFNHRPCMERTIRGCLQRTWPSQVNPFFDLSLRSLIDLVSFYSSKGLVIRKDKHSKKWKVNKKCEGKPQIPTDNEEKWKWAHERCVVILKDASSSAITAPFSPCLQKLTEERRKNLYDQCMEETCRYA